MKSEIKFRDNENATMKLIKPSASCMLHYALCCHQPSKRERDIVDVIDGTDACFQKYNVF